MCYHVYGERKMPLWLAALLVQLVKPGHSFVQRVQGAAGLCDFQAGHRLVSQLACLSLRSSAVSAINKLV